MKKNILVLLFCLLVVANVSGSTNDECGKLFSYFYLHSSPETFIKLQKCVDENESELRGEENHTENIVATMIAKISGKYNWPITSIHFGSKAKEIKTGISAFAKYIVDDSKAEAKKLDLWWASFSATGELKYIEKIFQFAGEDFSGHTREKMLTVGAASWSFKANCNQHEKVKKFAEEKFQNGGLGENKMDYLKSCIK